MIKDLASIFGPPSTAMISALLDRLELEEWRPGSFFGNYLNDNYGEDDYLGDDDDGNVDDGENLNLWRPPDSSPSPCRSKLCL